MLSAARSNPTPRPWYELSSAEPAPAAPALAGHQATRVAILGGGLAGLATALSLAERGIPATLVEAGELGSGASGRNGGIASAGFTRDAGELAGELGTAAAIGLHSASLAGLRLLRQRVARHAILARPVDGLVVASCFDDPAGLRAEATFANTRLGMRLEVKDRAWMAATYRSPLYTEGLFDPDGCHLDPLALTRGYARAAIALGASLHGQSRVLELGRDGAGWSLRTGAGRLTAEHLVLAGNTGGSAIAGAGLGRIANDVPEVAALARAILPVATYVIVTEPLGDRLAQAITAPFAVYDDRFATGYYHPLPEGRLLWGGRVALWPAAGESGIAALMAADLALVYPQLRGVEIAAAWSGWMGFARHKMPILGSLAPGLWVTTGYGGHGLNTTTMGGELIAQAIAGDSAPLAAFQSYRPRPVYGPLGRLAALLIYRGLGLQDRLRIRHRRRHERI